MTDDDLRALYQSALPTADHDVDFERIVAAQLGELDPETTAAILDRVAEDEAWAAAWQEARGMLELREVEAPQQTTSEQTTSEHTTSEQTTSTTPMFANRGWIAAAALAAVVLLSFAVLFTPSSTPTFRDGSDDEVTALSEAVQSRDSLVLRWAGVPSDARVHVFVRDSRLDVLHEAAGLGLTEARVPIDALADIPDGTEILWSVRVTPIRGEPWTSQTYRVRLR